MDFMILGKEVLQAVGQFRSMGEQCLLEREARSKLGDPVFSVNSSVVGYFMMIWEYVLMIWGVFFDYLEGYFMMIWGVSFDDLERYFMNGLEMYGGRVSSLKRRSQLLLETAPNLLLFIKCSAAWHEKA